MHEPEFPRRGISWKELEERLIRLRAADPPWLDAGFFWGWPNPGGGIHAIAKDASTMFFNQFWLGRFALPSGARLVQETVQMVREILRAPAGGSATLTSGGTESNFLALLAARNAARQFRPNVQKPNVVIPWSGHPSISKAAHYLCVDVVRVPTRADTRADIEAMSAAIDANTIMLLGSAPPYPHGLCDPIPEIAKLAQEHGLWCHVDACVGGFLLPFLRELGRGDFPFDFVTPGVRSVSADLHKFGFAPTGISCLVLRDAGDHEHQTFSFSDWPFGSYRTDTFVGSRTTAAVAAAWTMLKHLGTEGYLELARRTLEASTHYREAILGIKDLRLFAEPEAGILSYTSDTLSVPAIAAGMLARGTPVSYALHPPAIHLLLQPIDEPRQIARYIEVLAAAVEDVRRGRVDAAAGGASYA